ncbi:anti-adapter protein IraP [Escherichia albertii]|uniref:anti-adapter protein IraP n=1 Tax=Escherichia albertii TaxID=208962 RepID=UPI00222FAD8E|nr:anti-adapter protein IraP [Escherichia albertii]MCW3802469.1 anti-adapter protein IraP [Escherichia albertii]
MKNLISELLFRLAQKEEESKELCAQVEALEIIVTAMLRNMAQNDQQRLIDQVEGAYAVKPDASIPDGDTELLRDYVKKLLRYPRQ